MMDDRPTQPGLVKGIWKILTLKCDEATRLVSDGFDRDLHPMERIALRMHLISCGPCKRMRAQFTLLNQAGSRLAKGLKPAPDGPDASPDPTPDASPNDTPDSPPKG